MSALAQPRNGEHFLNPRKNRCEISRKVCSSRQTSGFKPPSMGQLGSDKCEFQVRRKRHRHRFLVRFEQICFGQFW